MKAAKISEGPCGNDKPARYLSFYCGYAWVLCNDLDKKQQVLSDLYFTLVVAENADSFLPKRRENVLQSSSWDPCQIRASFFCNAKLILVCAVVARTLVVTVSSALLRQLHADKLCALL